MLAINTSAVRRSAQVPFAKLLFFTLISAFVLLAPMSVTGDRSRGGDDLVKWGRVIVLACLGLTGLNWLSFAKQPVAARLVVLAGVFTIAAAWSTSPIWGFAFKGMFLASIIAGVMLSNSLATETDVRIFLRCMTLTAMFGIFLAAAQILVQTSPVMIKGRLWIGSLNPNLLAQAATMFALLSTFHLLVKDKTGWMLMALVNVIVMLCITFLSGSRGAVLMLLSGAAILLPALGRRQKQVILLGALSLGALALASFTWFSDMSNEAYLESHTEEEFSLRLTRELTKNTRGKLWYSNIVTTMRDAPMIGRGWLHRNNRGRNVQSAYIQIFVDSGVVGLVFLCAFLFSVIPLLYRSLKLGRRISGLPAILCYALSATAFALLLHGAFESSLVTGASPNAIVLAFSISQLDRMQAFRTQQLTQAKAPVQRLRPRMTPQMMR